MWDGAPFLRGRVLYRRLLILRHSGFQSLSAPWSWRGAFQSLCVGHSFLLILHYVRPIAGNFKRKGVVISHSGAALSSFRLRRRSEEHTSELQSLMRISYAVFCLKKQKHKYKNNEHLTNCMIQQYQLSRNVLSKS